MSQRGTNEDSSELDPFDAYSSSGDELPTHIKGIEDTVRKLANRIIGDQIAVKAALVTLSSTPYNNEVLIVKNAIAKRKNEFICGRNLLRSLLDIYDFPGCEILRGNLGQPLLPDGFIGSISHDASIVIGLLMPNRPLVQAVGIDIIGPSSRVDDSLLSIISSENEKYRLFNNNKPYSPLKVIFSIKESVVKILSPLLQRYINLQDIVLTDYSRQDGHIVATYKHRPEIRISANWSEFDNFTVSVAMLKGGT